MSAVNEIQVVPVTESHINGLHKALATVIAEGRYLALTEAPSLFATAAFRDMLSRNGCPQLAALDGKRVVGWADLRPHDASPDIGVLGMGVLPDYRGKGLGRRLLEELIARSRFARIELGVFADNTAALALYEKAGFVRENVAQLHGRDLVLMSRDSPSARGQSQKA